MNYIEIDNIINCLTNNFCEYQKPISSRKVICKLEER